MHRRRPARLLTGWIAGLALLLAALAPSLSQALGATPGAAWTEICTAQGPARVPAGAGGSHEGPAGAHPFEHCPFCSFQAHGPALPPAPLDQPSQGGVEPRPLALLAAPHTLHAWAVVQPRGPPQRA